MRKENKTKTRKKKTKSFFRKIEKHVLVLGIACLILFAGVVSMSVWNYNLQKNVKELNENINVLSVQAVNDFSLFVMNKVDKCEPVTLMSDDKSITINNIQCR